MTEPFLKIEVEDRIATLTMNRPDKRNAMSDGLLAELDSFFSTPPDGVRAVVLTGSGGHYCSGLDLSEHVQRDAEQTMRHSRGWHSVMDRIQFSGLPIVSAMLPSRIVRSSTTTPLEATSSTRSSPPPSTTAPPSPPS